MERRFAGWVWPLPLLGARRPVISDNFGRTKRGGAGHLGVDLMYQRALRGVPQLPDRSAMYEVPSGQVVAIAAGPGTVRTVNRNDPHGVSVMIDHHQVPNVGPRVTVYRHLAHAFVDVGQDVDAGRPLGIVGHDPSNSGDPNHLHFEMWDTSRPGMGRDAFAVDPEPEMSAWDVLARPGPAVNLPELVAFLIAAGLVAAGLA